MIKKYFKHVDAKLKFDFDFFHDYVIHVETSLHQEQEKIGLKWLEHENHEYQTGNVCSYDEDEIANEDYKFRFEFPNTFRYATIIHTYSVFEKTLKGVCCGLADLFETDFTIKDLKG